MSDKSLRDQFAERYGIASSEVFDILKATAFRQRGGNRDDEGPVVVSDAELTALLVIANQYGLNPFTREIYAFPDKQGGGIVPIVSYDGWTRIVNENPQFDGIEYAYAPELVELMGLTKPMHEWTECSIWRKDRTRPIIIREYAVECYRAPFIGKSKYKDGATYQVDGPWQTHPRRMLRIKSHIQCARVAFGFAGIYDQDEAERIIEMGAAVEVDPRRSSADELMPRAIENNPSPVANFTQTAAAAEVVEPVRKDPPAADYTAAPNRFARERDDEQRAPAQAARRATPRAQTSAPVEQEQNATNGQPSMFTDEAGPAASPAALQPPSEGALKVLRRKMDIAGRNEVDLRAKFGFGFDGITRASYGDVQAWASSE